MNPLHIGRRVARATPAGTATDSRAVGEGRYDGLVHAAGTLGPPLAFGFLPLALMALYLAVELKTGLLGVDFRNSFWPAAQSVLHGHTPYPPLDAHVLSKRSSFVYPPIVAIVIAPVALVPAGLATVIAVLIVVMALLGTLWVLSVRDWRCYTVALASPPMLACMQTAALSSLLALAIAMAWRKRTSGAATPVWIVVAIAAKLFLWPLLIWLALVRGIRCALLTAGACAAVVLAPWLLGFPGEHQYPRLLSMLTTLEGRHAFTPRSLVLSVGGGARLGEALALLVGGATLVIAIAIRNRPDADRRTLALTLLAALLLSPIVWAHYLLVLVPPIAISSRRLNAVWLVPWALAFSSGTWKTPSAPEIAVALAVMIAVTALVLRAPVPRASPREEHEGAPQRARWRGVAALL